MKNQFTADTGGEPHSIVGKTPLVRLRVYAPGLNPSLHKLAQFILDHPETCARLSIDRLCEAAGISKATVVRLCKRIGYTGFREFRIQLIRELEQANFLKSESDVIDRHDLGLRFIVREVCRSMVDLAALIESEDYRTAVRRLVGAKQIVWYGTGLSGHLVRMVDHKFSVSGFNSRSVTDPDRLVAIAELITDDDVIVVVSHSGTTSTVVGPMEKVSRGPGYVIAVTNHADTPLAGLSDLCLITADREYRSGQRTFPWRHSQEALIDALLLDALREKRPGEVSGPWQQLRR